MKNLCGIITYLLLGSVLLLSTQAAIAENLNKKKQKNAHVEKFEKGLKSQDVAQRRRAAKEIAASVEIDVETKVGLLLEALKDEHVNPQSNKVETWSGYTTVSEHIKRQYVFSLKTIGKSAVPILREYYKKEDGEVKERLAIALGSLGDIDIYNDLLTIFKKTKNPYTKAAAIRTISDLGVEGTELIPLFKAVLKDDFHVRMKSDVIYPPEADYRNIYYPVREEAYSALTKLGVKVKRMKKEFYIEE